MSSKKKYSEKEIEHMLKAQSGQKVPDQYLRNFEHSVMTRLEMPDPSRPLLGITAGAGILVLAALLGLAGFYCFSVLAKAQIQTVGTVPAETPKPADKLSLVEQLTLIEEVDVDAKDFLIELMGQENYVWTEFQILQPVHTVNTAPKF